MKGSWIVLAVFLTVVSAGCRRFTVDVTNGTALSDAMVNARPGMDIVLAPGEYKLINRRFIIEARGTEDCPITISCKNPGEAFIIGPMDLANSYYVVLSNVTVANTLDCLSCAGKYVTIENVHLTGCNKNGLYFMGASYVTVRNCTFDNMRKIALYIGNTKNSVFEKCTFGNNISVTAVSIDYLSCKNEVSNCSFYGSGYDGDSPTWIYVGYNSGSNNIKNNSFEDVDGDRIKYGVTSIIGSRDVYQDNVMVLGKGAVGFRVGEARETVCASNKVSDGATLTDGKIDPSC